MGGATMNRTGLAALCAAAMLAAVPTASARVIQRESGVIHLPLGPNCPLVEAILQTTVRAGQIAGFRLDVDPATRGGPFTLRTTGPASDIDIWFDTPAGSFSSRSPGGEAGTGPQKATRAWICLFAGTPTGFRYVAHVPADHEQQVESGRLVVPLPGRVGGAIVESCPGVTDATLRWASGRQPAHRFEIDATTWGARFRLDTLAGFADVDISFELPGSDRGVATAAPGGERGTVPAGATHAWVCLKPGAATTFVYRAASAA